MFVGLTGSSVGVSSTISGVSTADGVDLQLDNENVNSATMAIRNRIERSDFINTSLNYLIQHKQVIPNWLR